MHSCPPVGKYASSAQKRADLSRGRIERTVKKKTLNRLSVETTKTSMTNRINPIKSKIVKNIITRNIKKQK